MAISQERFEEIVLAVAASRFQQVRVTGFTIWVTVESRRRHRTYEVYAVYDRRPITGPGMTPTTA